jgi:hypothetical protein
MLRPLMTRKLGDNSKSSFFFVVVFFHIIIKNVAYWEALRLPEFFSSIFGKFVKVGVPNALTKTWVLFIIYGFYHKV